MVEETRLAHAGGAQGAAVNSALRGGLTEKVGLCKFLEEGHSRKRESQREGAEAGASLPCWGNISERMTEWLPTSVERVREAGPLWGTLALPLPPVGDSSGFTAEEGCIFFIIVVKYM